MAITLEDISVKFGVDKTELDEAFQQVNTASKTLDTALKAIGIGFVVKKVIDLTGALKGLVAESAEALAITDSYARRLGVATEGMIGLQTAARQFGVEQEEVNEGIKNMSERIADAYINGTGAAGDALKALGVDLDELIKLGPDEQFLRVAEALSKVEDEAQRTFLSMEIGQEEFFRLNELIALGSDGIRELISETSHLNADLSAIDFENIRGMQTAAGNASLAFDSIIDQITADLAPSLERVFDIAADWFASFREDGLPIVQDFFGAFIDNALHLAQKVLPEILTVGSAVWDGLRLGISAIWEVTSQVLGAIGTGWGLIFDEVTGESDWVSWLTENLAIAAKTWPELIANAFLSIGKFISGVLSSITELFMKGIDELLDVASGVAVSLRIITQEEFEEAAEARDKAQRQRQNQNNFFDDLAEAQQAIIDENNKIIEGAAREVIDERERNQNNISDLIGRLVNLSPEQDERIRNAEERARRRGAGRGGAQQRDRLEEANNKEKERFDVIAANTTEAFKVFNRGELEAKGQNEIAQEQKKTTDAVNAAMENIVNAIDGLIPGFKRNAISPLKITTGTL